MRVVHINLSDSQGGAAIASRRLHLALRQAGHDSCMLVWRKYTDDPNVDLFEKRPLPRGLSQLVGRKLDTLGFQYLFHPASMRLPDHPWIKQADIINLHLSHGSYFSTRVLPRLSRLAPIVWTMHDLWAVTGHCAFAAADVCNRWQTGCGKCPQLGDSPAIRFDLTRSMWQIKQRIYGNSRLAVACPSAWLAAKMAESPLLNHFPISVVANGLDLTTFRPIPKEVARAALGLPAVRKVLMFGAASLTDPRKGIHLLQAALSSLQPSLRKDLTLLIVGAKSNAIIDELHDFDVREMGAVDNETLMALCYAAADLFVMPSLAENLPNTLVESLACGTPCVCFDIGGCPEIIEHGRTGYLAQPFEIEDLARGITSLLRDDTLRQQMTEQAPLQAARLFDARLIAPRYIELYQQTRNIYGLA